MSGCCGLYFPNLTILIGFSTYINLKHYFMYKHAATVTSRFHYGFYSIMVTLIIYRINPSMAAATEPINPYHKSLSASDKYPTIHHFVTEMCTDVHISVTKWCIVEYGTGILWDLCDRSISSVPSSPQFFFRNIKTLFTYWISCSYLTHWGRLTHICVNKLTIIGSDNGLSLGRRQAIIWTNVGILLIRPLGTNFSDTLIEI